MKNRQIILSDLDVDNADAYIRTYRKIKKIHELKSNPNERSKYEELIQEIRDGKKKSKSDILTVT